MPEEVFIGFGSNLGNRLYNIKKALEILSHKVKIKAVSSIYETEPVDIEGNRFLNGVALIETGFSPEGLLEELERVEAILGRKEKGMYKPRTIDLDILIFGNRCISTPVLTIPHPRISEREFVLKGLFEIAPDLIVPGLGRKIKELYTDLQTQGSRLK